MRRVVLLLAAVGVVFAGVADSALGASSVFLCVPSTAGEAVTSGGSTGTCGAGTSSVALPSEKAEQEKLISILPHINYEASGIDKQPTVQFSGVNLQVIDGTGLETTISGGKENKATGEASSIGGGGGGEASGPLTSVVGGRLGKAKDRASTVLGGLEEETEAEFGVTP